MEVEEGVEESAVLPLVVAVDVADMVDFCCLTTGDVLGRVCVRASRDLWEVGEASKRCGGLYTECELCLFISAVSLLI